MSHFFKRVKINFNVLSLSVDWHFKIPEISKTHVIKVEIIMTVINTNTSSMIARDAINRNDRAMSSAMERLSTGSHINGAKDDAAGLAQANQVKQTVLALLQ